MIKIKGLTKKYNKIKIINNFSYSFKRTGIYMILGKSGSGKTTLLNIIGGIDKKYQGEIGIDENVLYFKDKNNLVNGLKVKEIIKVFEKANDKQVKDLFLLDKLFNKKYKKLSLGEKQLVILTLVLNSKNKIIILDEPFSALSNNRQKEACAYLEKLSKDKLIIIASHNKIYFNKYHCLDLENLKKEKVSKFVSYNKEKYQKMKLFYYLLYFKKTLGRKLIFVLSLFFIIYSFINISSYSNSLFNKNLLNNFINNGTLISRTSSINELDDNIFYEIVKKLSPHIIGYNANYYDSNLYAQDILIDKYYIDNGFSLSSFEYIEENMKEGEVIIGINYNKFCTNNKLFNCDESYLKTLLINKKINDLNIKIHDIRNANETIFFINERLYRVSDDYEYVEYYFDVDIRDVNKIFYLINEDDFLLNFDYIKKGVSENIVRYSVKSSDSKKFNYKIDYSKYIVCLQGGYDCLNYLNHFNSLIAIETINEINNLNLEIVDDNLLIDEIVISSNLSKKLNKKENEFITLYFNYNNEVINSELKIKRIINNENDVIYQNSKWSYEFFKYKLLFDEEDLQIKNILIYEDRKEGDYISDNEYNDMLKNIEKTFKTMKKTINIINYSVTMGSIIILILIEMFANKFKKEYFAYLNTLKISNKKHFIKK